MYDDLKRLAENLDEVQREVWRQQTYASDPNLKTWCSTSARELDDMKEELEDYINRAESAGRALR